jgi:signal transduction histidine kinase
MPRTLATRLVVVAALLLLFAQAISFALLVQENRRQMVTVSAAPAALRIIEALEGPGSRRGPPMQRERVDIFLTQPRLPGQEAPAIAARAAEMFENAGIAPRKVIAHIDSRRTPPPRAAQIINGKDAGRGGPRSRLHLAVQTADGKWLFTTSRVREGGPPIARLLIWQTLLICAAVLLPLLWIGRKLSAPLGVLTSAARDYSPHKIKPTRLNEQGPDDVRELTRAFNDMQTRIGGMLAEKDHMLGAIGHDLRTPLASLRVRVESVDDAEERQSMVTTIEEMNHMLEDILALARAGSDRQPPQRVDLASLAEAVADDFAAMGADSSFEESDRTIVNVHAPAIKRAVRNLIDNALKYGVRARVSVRTEDGKAVLRVEDDGPGIDPARIPDMLEPFTRLEQSRNRETGGSGLGLALVRAVMRAEGGDLDLFNRADGKGFVTEIRLKLA